MISTWRAHAEQFISSLSPAPFLFNQHTKQPRSFKDFKRTTSERPTIPSILAEPSNRKHYSKMSDVEKMIGGDYAQLTNTNLRSFAWKGVTVTVKDRQSQQPKTLLSDVNGIVKAGELLALMGPS